MPVLVELKNVTKVIKRRKIIDSLSFEIREGEVFGLLGPNGAGKTTTIRMIVGLISMDDGDIFICNQSIRKNFEQAIQHVGAIVENPEMYKFLSGYENLMHYARMMKGIDKQQMEEVIELVGLRDRIHDKVKTYSLGMRQRLGLAQSLLHNPKVLILDEPTNGLDPSGIREMRDHLHRLAKERRMGIIVSSHLLSEMEMMCDRIGIIQNGKLMAIQMVKNEKGNQHAYYGFQVDKGKMAYERMVEKWPNLTVHWEEAGVLTVHAQKDHIPELIKELVLQDIRIVEVKEMSKTLEERFLEITNREEVN